MGDEILDGPSGPEAVDALMDELIEAIKAVYRPNNARRYATNYINNARSELTRATPR